MESRPHRRSFGWPLLLIAIGVGFLLTNLGILRGDVWEILAIYWPVLFIIFGLDNIWQGEGLAGAILGIGIGVIFLLSNLGYLGVGIWEIVFRFWPLLIVAAGLDLLIGRRGYRAVWSTLAGLLVVAGLVLGVLWLNNQANRTVNLESQTIRQAIEDSSNAEVEISMIAGELRLSDTAASTDLVEGEIGLQRGERLRKEYRTTGDTAILKLGIEGVTTPTFNTNPSQGRWDLNLNPVVETDLKLNVVAGNLVADLSKMQLTSLDSDVVFGQSNFQIPANTKYRGDISTLVGNTVIQIPSDASIRIEADTLLGNVSIPEGFTRDGDWIYSPAAREGTADVDLKVTVLVGRVELRVIE